MVVSRCRRCRRRRRHGLDLPVHPLEPRRVVGRRHELRHGAAAVPRELGQLCLQGRRLLRAPARYGRVVCCGGGSGGDIARRPGEWVYGVIRLWCRGCCCKGVAKVGGGLRVRVGERLRVGPVRDGLLLVEVVRVLEVPELWDERRRDCVELVPGYSPEPLVRLYIFRIVRIDRTTCPISIAAVNMTLARRWRCRGLRVHVAIPIPPRREPVLLLAD
ncbi:hypothetical protein F5X99DRAFT_40309 [Biscogniauxia marginata]|nr:hypothetical protein F5X99DRAFT_40309 [Biscogniauxia marginata]